MKEILRKLYYKLTAGRTVLLEKPEILRGKKWITHTLAGRSYWKGYYEPPITNIISQQLSEDSVFFDIGSNVGYFSLLAAVKAYKGHVHSFEPDRLTFDYAESIRQINNLPNWTANNQGVSERTETLFYSSGPTSTTGIITSEGGEVMSIISIDDYVNQKSLHRIDLIKIDVEGYGGHVLQGAVETLMRFKPAILMELHAGTNEFEYFQKLVSPHYNLFTIDGLSVSDVVKERPDHILAIHR